MQLYRPAQRRLSAYCRVVTGNEGKALDLIQETLTIAFESFDKLRNRDSFLFFLFSIARNCHLKQQRALRFFGKQSEIKTLTIAAESDSTEINYDIEFIHRSIACLNSEQREVILMFHILGFPITDIAQNLKITEAAVKNRLVRGRENLRKLLSDKETLNMNSISTPNTNAK